MRSRLYRNDRWDMHGKMQIGKLLGRRHFCIAWYSTHCVIIWNIWDIIITGGLQKSKDVER